MSFQHLHPAERLKRVREALNLSQREFSKELGVTNGAIAHWESGMRPIPGPVMKLLNLYEDNLLTNQPASKKDITQLDLYKSLKKSVDDLGLSDEVDKLNSYARDSWNQNQIVGKIKIAALNRLINSLKNSKGISIKVAQLASFLEMGLPVEIRSALGSLQSSLKPTPRQEITKLIEEEYGKSLKEVFSYWDPTPLAVTSLGQVHKARLLNGQDVAVKVQHPEISKILSKQFDNIKFIHTLASILNRGNDEIMNEIKRAIVAECDYFREARNQEKFRNIFAEKKFVIIPQVFHEYTRARVLVTEFVRGENFYSFAAKASQERKNHAAQVLLETMAHSAFSHCFTHGDLHPGNFLFRDNHVIFLDFGRMIDYPEDRMKLEIQLYLALLHKNYDRTKELAKVMFAKDPENFDFDEFWNFLMNSQAFLMTHEKFKFTREYVSRMSRESRRFSAKNQLRASPEAFWAFVFSSSMWGLYADLEAECPWRQIALDIFTQKPLTLLK